MNFFIVDVFAEAKYTGNQLAVFTEAAALTPAAMQQIAREMNYSETTFILSSKPRDEGYDVRIFTPSQELSFAGHPTLGTAFVLQQAIIQQSVEKIVLNLPIGPVPVTLRYGGGETQELWMQQPPPEFGATLTAAEVAAAVNLPVAAIDTRYPIQEVSTGLPFLLVPLVSLDSLRQARTDRDRLAALVANLKAQMIFLFCPETREPENHLSARMFADTVGIPEDPATGSANGCLAAYLSKYRYLGSETVQATVEQGDEIQRPSRLRLQAAPVGDTIQVKVGGKVQMIARGELV